jgi:hypothetical protein
VTSGIAFTQRLAATRRHGVENLNSASDAEKRKNGKAANSNNQQSTRAPMSQPIEIVFPTDEQDLHQAVERLPHGGILRILPGTYKISKTLTIDKDIRIIGTPNDPRNVVIKGRDKIALNIIAGNAIIEGVSIQGSGLSGIAVSGTGNPIFRDCRMDETNEDG